jgi:haloalkane dehalogenase
MPGHRVESCSGSAWGFLYRDFIPFLVQAGYRVVVPDMIGFGLSEKPVREHAHTLDGHAANLVALLRRLALDRVTLVCHDWGGPTGLSYALSNPERMRALVVMSTWAWPAPPAEFHTRIFPWRTMHAPLVGPYLLGSTTRSRVEASICPSSIAKNSGNARRPHTRRCSRIPLRAC